MKYAIVQGTVVVLEFESGVSAVVCIAATSAMADKIVEALNLKVATDVING